MGAGIPTSYRFVRNRLQLSALATAAAFTAAAGVAGVFLATAFFIPLLFLYPIAELVFAIWFFRRWRKYNQNLHERMPPADHDGLAVFQRFVDSAPELSKVLDVQGLFSRWFGGVPFSSIQRENLADLLCYGFLYKSRAALEAEGRGDLPTRMLEQLEAAWGLTVAPGRNPSIRFMDHLWQPLRCHYRPLAFYLVGELLALLKHVCLLVLGFRGHRLRGMVYYTRDMASGSKPARTPVLYMHGVGLGLLPYIPFLIRLAALGHPIIAVEFPHLSMRLCTINPDIDAVVERVIQVLDLHQAGVVSVAGHSYGTLLSSRVVQLHRERVHSLTLIDPVCFCMFTGHLIRNFVYRTPRRIEDVTAYVISRDFHTSVATCRNFFWTMLNLWPDQLPASCTVVLSEYDALVPVDTVHAMLRNDSQAVVLRHPSHMHADFIHDLKWQDEVTDQIAKMLGASHARSDSCSSYGVLGARSKCV